MNPEIPRVPIEELENFERELHETANRKIRESYEKERYFESRRKKIPEKLYHVTTKQNAKQILREGIDPSKLYFEDREVVSLSDDKNFALNVAVITQNTDVKNLVVLEIDTRFLTPSRIDNYLTKADPENPNPIEGAEIHEVHYDSVIPPDAIKVVKQ